jgi:enoyl-CoA hydratase
MTTVRCSDHPGGVRLLTLDRPPANALDETLLTDLAASLDQARRDDAVRALIVTGRGDFFSAGFDLAAPRRDAAAARTLRTLYRDAHMALLACDYRLGSEGDYRIGLNEVAIGASFPRVALEIVRLRLPHARAAELALGAALYPAAQATRLGVVDEMLPADRLDDTVLRRAARLGGFPREAYAHTKAALVADALARVAAETADEEAAAAAVWTTAESRAARAAQRARLSAR